MKDVFGMIGNSLLFFCVLFIGHWVGFDRAQSDLGKQVCSGLDVTKVEFDKCFEDVRDAGSISEVFAAKSFQERLKKYTKESK